MLWQVYHGTFITADILRYIYIYLYIYYSRCITADILRTTKTAISRQMYRARDCRLLHPNLFVATHHPSKPRDLPDSAEDPHKVRPGNPPGLFVMITA